MKIAAAVAVLVASASVATAADYNSPPSQLYPSAVPFSVQAPGSIRAHDWTGIYIGAHGGYMFGEDETQLFVSGVKVPLAQVGVSTRYKPEGFLGGLHLGYNQQVGSSLFGVEGDIETASLRGTLNVSDAALPGYGASASTDIKLQGSIRARFGLIADQSVLYVTGGAAAAHIENVYSATVPGGNPFGVPAGKYSENASGTRIGFTVGAGFEHAITDNISARLEYRYTRYAAFRNASTYLYPTGEAEQRPSFHTIRAGVSYRF